MGIEDKYNRLNQAEKDFLFWHPIAAISFNSNASTALEEARKRFGPTTLHNGSGDAFRHCFWSAMNARDQGADLARGFGNAHEDWIGNPPAEKAMDLHNNGVGYGIGTTYIGASDRALAVLCVQAWASKKLVQIDVPGGSDLIYSNSYEKALYES
jgi:hypothetical protein